jgi:hypothetical protein
MATKYELFWKQEHLLYTCVLKPVWLQYTNCSENINIYDIYVYVLVTMATTYELFWKY